VSASLEKRQILRNVSFEVSRGSCLAIIGSSGDGKTTLLRVIAGFVPASTGSITLFGKIANRMLPEERGVSMLFQDPVLFNHLTAEDNAMVGMPREANREDHRRKVNELLHLFRLDDPYVLKRRVGTLSGGERQRAALVRTFANARDILLLDEPLKSSVNVNLRWEILRSIRELITGGHRTTIVVTHDFEEAAYLATSVIAIVRGVASPPMSPADLYLQPPTQTIARLSGPTNEINATVFLDDSQRGEFYPVNLTGRPVWRHPEACVAAFRPNAARVIRAREEFTVISTLFLGHSRTAVLKATRQREGKTIEVTIPQGETLSVGDRVGVDIDSEAVLLYDGMGERLLGDT
jgi:ABC-type Fe3+/spermidine/putrescine transport system ATPase subunit